MTQSLSESRFYMWRAVVALAHVDGRVTVEEKELVESYLANLPGTEDQENTLRKDLLYAQDVSEMFGKITAPEDQGEFFQFARIMNWSDGDLDAQEDALFEKFQHMQMGKLDQKALEAMVKDTRKAFSIERLKQDEEFEREAKDIMGLGRLLDAFKRNPSI